MCAALSAAGHTHTHTHTSTNRAARCITDISPCLASLVARLASVIRFIWQVRLCHCIDCMRNGRALHLYCTAMSAHSCGTCTSHVACASTGSLPAGSHIPTFDEFSASSLTPLHKQPHPHCCCFNNSDKFLSSVNYSSHMPPNTTTVSCMVKRCVTSQCGLISCSHCPPETTCIGCKAVNFWG